MARTLDLIDLVFMRIAQTSLVLMMISISADSLGRYLLNAPLQGSFEFNSLYLMVIVTFFGMPAAYSSGGMIRLDVLTESLSLVPYQLSERFNTLAGAIVFGFIAWHAGHEAYEKFASRDTTFGVIEFPVYWSYVWVPLGCLQMALRLAYETIFPAIRPVRHDEVFE
ncbi:TRAP transporter small permease [Paracoccus sp. SCSIO 75233]|uniref:TRAP transporter small permease n=1 Tax=Paracoccus sp. SCSIO 75233 TaxID=3017782 RepID=UPI0022F0AF66|nr:TRAP transporter small permease [Paracoccus sp. SCSIO 75233]WBU52432.1 TRAP transporter small permease [Paracoccus sp. SCSIO 75233]